MAIGTTKASTNIEGGEDSDGTYSTEEGANPRKISDHEIKVREPLLSEILTKVHGAKTESR